MIEDFLAFLNLSPEEIEIFWAYYNNFHTNTRTDDPVGEGYIYRVAAEQQIVFDYKFAACVVIATHHTSFPPQGKTAEQVVMEMLLEIKLKLNNYFWYSFPTEFLTEKSRKKPHDS